MRNFWMTICLLICLGFSACAPTPRKVNEAIGRGELEVAIKLLSQILNEDGEITQSKLDRLLKALATNHTFRLSDADELFERLKLEAKPAILDWYATEYLKVSENLIRQAEECLRLNTYLKRKSEDSKMRKSCQDVEQNFEKARVNWKRYRQKRAEYFPGLKEPTPVLGIISLREADYWLNRRQSAKAKQAFEKARKELSGKAPFDKVQQLSFRDLLDEVRTKLEKVK